MACPKCEIEAIIDEQKEKTEEILEEKVVSPTPMVSLTPAPVTTPPTTSQLSVEERGESSMSSRTELPMEKIFDEIFYLRNYRKNNLYIIAGTFMFIIGFLIWFMWSIFDVWKGYFGYNDPFWFIITGTIVGGILGVVWLIRGNDIKRGIPYTLRPRKSLKKYRVFRKHLYNRLGLVPKTYYQPNMSIEDKEKDLLLWASDKRLGIGFKILQYVICALICLVAIILINQYPAFFGLTLIPLNILIFMILIGIFSIVPNSIRKYYCLSPIYFTYWIMDKWMSKDQQEPYGTYYKPLYVNLRLITKNYLDLEIKQINEIVANIFSYFIVRVEKDIEDSANIDKKLSECLKNIDDFIKKYAIDHKNYLSKKKAERIKFNNDLDQALEHVFFKFLLIADDIQRYNEKQIGKVSIKFKITWKQRLWENFSKLLFSAGAASIITIITGLVSTM